MHPRSRKPAAAVATTCLIIAMGGCTSEGTKAVPELPDRICWDMFSSEDVKPLLQGGSKAVTYSSRFSRLMEHGSISCSLDIDGVPGFFLTAYKRDSAQEIDWSSRESARPASVGEKGIIWHGGGSSYFVCTPSGSAVDSRTYIDLTLTTLSAPENAKPRDLLLKLLRQYVDAVRAKLDCPA